MPILFYERDQETTTASRASFLHENQWRSKHILRPPQSAQRGLTREERRVTTSSSQASLVVQLDFLSPITAIKGFGPRRVAGLNESGIETVGDLLYHFPRRYLDRSTIVPIGQVGNFINSSCTIAGIVEKTRVERWGRGRLRALLKDATGEVELLWFGTMPAYRNMLTPGVRVMATGKIGKYRHLQMVHPMIDRINDEGGVQGPAFFPIYPISESMREAGLTNRILFKAIQRTLDAVTRYPEILPEQIVTKGGFPPLDQCLREIHQPRDITTLNRYRDRLRYEELFNLALTLRWSRRKFALPGRSMKPGDLPSRFRTQLPFTLTAGQEQAIATLYSDAASPMRMHRLLHGDVGCGKTLVAFFACFSALASGFQVAWLAPTEVLAMQTYKRIETWLGQLDLHADLLLGSTTIQNKHRIFDELASGRLRFIVGTHALIQHAVKFRSLGMIVIDEQHKFGAAQRLSLQEKDPASDFLLMSATPIPQTLAKTLYGDLDLVEIRESPAGRHPVSTHLIPENRRSEMERFIRSEIEKKQAAAYYVVPRIGQDEDSKSSIEIAAMLKKLENGTFKGIPIACLHGRMTSNEKELTIRSFADGSVRLLVSTTVVEVGVDVPHATCMVIEGAERFGMAQLHQLRGRVGRSGKKSYCFLLVSPTADAESLERISFFSRHHDGFRIADRDLSLRGPGEVAGFRQTGWEELRIADIVRDAELFRDVQHELDAMIPG